MYLCASNHSGSSGESQLGGHTLGGTVSGYSAGIPTVL